jgi:hypothetical protein
VRDEADRPYRVILQDGRYRVMSPGDQCMMVCNDEASAKQYGLMLNQAFDAGYRHALREKRQDD